MTTNVLRQGACLALLVLLNQTGCGEATLEALTGEPGDSPLTMTSLTVDPRPATTHRLPAEEDIACLHSSETPLLIDEVIEGGEGFGLTSRLEDLHEEDGGLDFAHIDRAYDILRPGAELRDVAPPFEFRLARINTGFTSFMAADYDGDCATNLVELAQGTDINDPDTDDDGWFDGPCNQRVQLYLTYIKAYDEQEDIGRDELYLIADNIRHPSSDLDDYWSFDDGDGKSYNRLMATRVRGRNTNGFRVIDLEGWEDDVEIANTWYPDDLLFEHEIDVGAYNDGQTFTRRLSKSDWDYKLTFRVEIEHFADPNPLGVGDTDGDGIDDHSEYQVARDFGGIADPFRQDILVEVDWMDGHGLGTRAKRLVTTQLHRHGYFLYIHRNAEIDTDGCLTRSEAIDTYNSDFNYEGYDAFRYAVMGETLWNDASGVAIGDTFLVDDSTWWINSMTLPQAGTFIHELGHTLGLTQSQAFKQIDTVGSVWYDSAMNYLYQATMVDFSDNGAGGNSNDHDDWEDVDPSDGLGWHFGSSTTANDGVCN